VQDSISADNMDINLVTGVDVALANRSEYVLYQSNGLVNIQITFVAGMRLELDLEAAR
jgi:hypothetical protein